MNLPRLLLLLLLLMLVMVMMITTLRSENEFCFQVPPRQLLLNFVYVLRSCVETRQHMFFY